MSQESPNRYSSYEIIKKKRDGHALSTEEIKWFIEKLSHGEIPDYQASALLMAIFLQGFDKRETADLTDSMLHSGEILNFQEGHIIDKHSTGGVGDKTSFVIAPLARACGVKVPMIAGRGLGHTGGTVDKAESIPGFRTSLDLKTFGEMLIKDGLVLMGQTDEIAKADKILYALRDVTATIESIPLITASIMSKKLAEGANGIVFDIKTGNGAFMSAKKDAMKLATSLRQTAKRFGKSVMTVITDMSQPLGTYAGHSLEIIECIETLKNNGPEDLKKECLWLAGGMIFLAEKARSHRQGIQMAKQALESGEGLKEFEKMLQRQGGDTSVIRDYSLLPQTTHQTSVVSPVNGYLKSIDCRQMGLYCLSLGGGRRKKTDQIDMAVGLGFHKKIGHKVKEGETVITIHHHKHQSELAQKIAVEMIDKYISFHKLKVLAPTLIGETKWEKDKS